MKMSQNQMSDYFIQNNQLQGQNQDEPDTLYLSNHIENIQYSSLQSTNSQQNTQLDQIISNQFHQQSYNLNRIKQEYQHQIDKNNPNQSNLHRNRQDNIINIYNQQNSSSYLPTLQVLQENDSQYDHQIQSYQYFSTPNLTSKEEAQHDQNEQSTSQNLIISLDKYQQKPEQQHNHIARYGIINKSIAKQKKSINFNSSDSSSDNESNERSSQCKDLVQISPNSQRKKRMILQSSIAKKKKKFEIINLVKSVINDHSFLIPGQVIINTQFDQGFRNIYVNSNIYLSAKKVEKVVFDKERETYESHFSTNFTGLNDFQFLIKLLESKQNQQIYEQAQVLKMYQQFINSHQVAIKQIQDSGLIDLELLQTNTEKFIQEGNKILATIPKDSIYLYFFNRINYSKGAFEELRFGFNKGMCAVVGLEQEEAVQFSNQMLLLCMMTPESQLKYYMSILQSEMNGSSTINAEFNQYTYDGIEIKLTTKQQIYHFPGQFSPKDFSLRVLEIEPDQNTLQQIIQERNKFGVNNKINGPQDTFKQDEFSRYKAGLQFLQEFYEKKNNKKTIKPLRCDFIIKDIPLQHNNSIDAKDQTIN